MKYPKDKYILNINDLSKLKEVYIYGTGISSQKLKELIKRNSIDIKILGFVDSYKKTTIIDNLKIYNIIYLKLFIRIFIKNIYIKLYFI